VVLAASFSEAPAIGSTCSAFVCEVVDRRLSQPYAPTTFGRWVVGGGYQARHVGATGITEAGFDALVEGPHAERQGTRPAAGVGVLDDIGTDLPDAGVEFSPPCRIRRSRPDPLKLAPKPSERLVYLGQMLGSCRNGNLQLDESASLRVQPAPPRPSGTAEARDRASSAGVRRVVGRLVWQLVSRHPPDAPP
jgi:hypothetical protein